MKHIIVLALSLLVLLVICCCSGCKYTQNANQEAGYISNQDTTFFNVHERMRTVEEYKNVIHRGSVVYPELKVKEIHSPLNISSEYFDKHLHKFRRYLDETIYSNPNLNLYFEFFKIEQIKSVDEFKKCELSVVPIYRLTPNLIEIDDFEKQQFADFCTLDTINFLVMVKKEDEIANIFFYELGSLNMKDASLGGGAIKALNLALHHSSDVFHIVPPDYGGGTSRTYAYKENGRVKLIIPVGAINCKSENGEYQLVEAIYGVVDNNWAFEVGKIGSTWLRSYYKRVKRYRALSKDWLDKKDPQFLVYPIED